MAKRGNKVVFEGKTCEIFNRNRELISVSKMVNAFYPLDCIVNATQHNETAMVAVKMIDIWHRRMGHICDSNLMKAKNSSIGIEFNPQNDFLKKRERVLNICFESFITMFVRHFL